MYAVKYIHSSVLVQRFAIRNHEALSYRILNYYSCRISGSGSWLPVFTTFFSTGLMHNCVLWDFDLTHCSVKLTFTKQNEREVNEILNRSEGASISNKWKYHG